MNRIVFLSACLLILCCDEPKEVYNLPTNAVSLLTADSTKTWKLAKRTNDGNRMNMGDCFLSFRETYNINMKVYDNNGENRDCGESLIAGWEIVKDGKENNFIKKTSPQIPKLMNIEDDFKNFKILHLSKDTLVIAFYHRQFSNKWRTIVDYMVPENVIVKDRNFHW